MKRDEKITTEFEALSGEDLINKTYLHTKTSKIVSQLSIIEKEYEYNFRNEKQSEQNLIVRVVKTTVEKLYDKGLIDNYDIADEVLKNYLLFDEVNERYRPDLEELGEDNVIQRFIF